MRRLPLLLLICLLLPLPLLAETVKISDQKTLHFELPQGWVSLQEPPQPLLEEMAEHIEHEVAAKGRHPTQEQLLRAAKKRFAANEALLYNPASMSYFTFDFSHLRQGEKSPSKKSIKLSAQYAGESLQNEEGVTDAQSTSKSTEVEGAWYAYRVDADYKHHEDAMHFSGIIGFASPYWFYFYFSDYLKDPQDKQRLEQVFKSIRIESK